MFTSAVPWISMPALTVQLDNSISKYHLLQRQDPEYSTYYNLHGKKPALKDKLKQQKHTVDEHPTNSTSSALSGDS